MSRWILYTGTGICLLLKTGKSAVETAVFFTDLAAGGDVFRYREGFGLYCQLCRRFGSRGEHSAADPGDDCRSEAASLSRAVKRDDRKPENVGEYLPPKGTF